jgi:hypothetical protein
MRAADHLHPRPELGTRRADRRLRAPIRRVPTPPRVAHREASKCRRNRYDRSGRASSTASAATETNASTRAPPGAPVAWSVYGAERLQTHATLAKECRRKSPTTPCERPPLIASACRGPEMVRRGSTVRVRQRALKKRCIRRFCSSPRLASRAACSGMEPFVEVREIWAQSDDFRGKGRSEPRPTRKRLPAKRRACRRGALTVHEGRDDLRWLATR